MNFDSKMLTMLKGEKGTKHNFEFAGDWFKKLKGHLLKKWKM